MSENHIPPNSQPAEASPVLEQSSHGQKILTIVLWSILLGVILVVVISRLIPSHPAMEVLFQAPRFALTDQNGRDLSAGDLRTKAYISDFIFTTCGSACPLMSRQMAEIQKQTPPGVQLVSFTVDPEHDTPAVLKEYATSYDANPLRWHFLTGTRQQMSDVAEKMKIQRPNEPNPAVNHSEKFFLVDGEGNVRGMYDREDAAAMKTLITDATWLSTTKWASGEK